MNKLKSLIIFSSLFIFPVLAFADNREYQRNVYFYPRNNSYYNNQHQGSCNYPRPNFQNSGYNKGNFSEYSFYQIKNGIRNGQLSHNEASELRGELSEIRDKERDYYRDGYLSNWERSNLNKDYREFNHDLKHELNDGEKRNYWRW